MAGVTARISLDIQAKLTGAAGLATAKVPLSISKELSFAEGTAAVGQTNILYQAQRTLAASTNEDLDLRGVLADALGATVNAAEIVAIYISAATGNTNNVNVTRPASNGFAGPFLAAGDGLAIPPGEFILLTNRNGWAVAAGTGDLLNIANSGGTTGVTYDIVALGRTVAA